MRASFLLALLLSACTGLKDRPVGDGDDTATEALGPQLVVSVESVDFGDVGFGDLETAAINVSNPGTESLILTSITVETPFRVSPAYLEVIPGATNVITLYAQPTEYGAFTKDLTLVTDSEGLGTVTIPLSLRTISDADGDGHDTIDAGGDDCDDADADFYPGAPDEWYDGEDHDCDGANDYDRDGDGYDAETDDHEPDAPDCNDSDVTFFPGAPDEPYDNKDTNCDGSNDWDFDGDGYESSAYGRGSDCDDFDDTVNREGLERLNAKDDDCNDDVDDDATAERSDYVYDHTGGNFARTGYSVAIGDLDNDGISEVIVGTPYLDATTSSGAGRGGVSVFLGPDLLPTGTDVDDSDHHFEGAGTSDLLGHYLTVMGDHDGDGVDDLAIGAPGVSSSSGAVYVLGGEDAIRSGRDASDAMATYTGNSSSSFGRGIGTEIDLNDDGMDELVVMYTGGGMNYVAVEYGSASPASNAVNTFDAKWTTDGSEVAFYRNAPVGGDLDGDGYEDLVLSDGMADYGTSDTGAMWVIWGQANAYNVATPADIESYATAVVRGSSSSDYDAWSTQLGDDWDGDGDNELWIYNADEALYVVEGGANRRAVFDPATEAAVSYVWNASSPDAEMIRRAGDWDGDGVSDMLVFIEDESGSYGLSELFGTTLRSGTYAELDDNIGNLMGSNNTDTSESNGNVGFGMAPKGGDVDGDGDSDMAVGDAEWQTAKGKAYVLLNKGTAGE